MDDVIVDAPSTDDLSETSDNSADTDESSGGPIDPSENTPDKPKEPKEKPADPLRSVKHKIKANGAEKELDYDELLKKAELAEGAYSKFEEGSKAKKEADLVMQKMKSGKIEDLLDVIPLDRLLEITSQIQKTQLELEGLSQQEIDDLLDRHEGQAAKAKLKQIEDEKLSLERNAQSQQAFHIIETEISGVLEEAKAQGVPLADLPDIGIEVVDELLAVLTAVEEAEKAGRPYTGKIPTAKDAFQKIQARYQSRMDTYLSKHSPDKLLSMLTPEQKKALRQASLDTLYGDSPRPGPVTQTESQVPASQTSKRMTVDQAFKQMELQFNRR